MRCGNLKPFLASALWKLLFSIYFFFFYNDEANGKYGVNKEGNISKPYLAGLSRIVVIWHSVSHPQTALTKQNVVFLNKTVTRKEDTWWKHSANFKLAGNT